MVRRKIRRRPKRASIVQARHSIPGEAPGTGVPHPDAPLPIVTVFSYDERTLVEEQITDLTRIEPLLATGRKIWVDVEGLGDALTVQNIGRIFGLHSLALEDAVHTTQRPKVDYYDGHIFCTMRMARLGERLEAEQIGIFIGRGFVITFQEIPGDCLSPVRDRLRKAGSRVRTSSSDYLAYSIIDAIVDHYFPLFEAIGERLETLEERIVIATTVDAITEIHELRHDLLLLRRAVWPLREALDRLVRDDESGLISEGTRFYLRDCRDHSSQLIDVYEMCRDIGSGLMEAYQSAIGARTGEVMRVLTVITTIFIPLSFIAGVYGMNFNPDSSPFNMPELNWFWGYPVAIGFMVLVTIALLFFFRRKGWLGAPPDVPPPTHIPLETSKRNE